MEYKFVLTGPKLTHSVPNISLGQHLYQCLSSHGEKVAQVDAVTGETRKYSEIFSKSLNIAGFLCSRGLKSGDVVGICSENNLDFILPVVAAYLIGATCAPLNPKYTIYELQHAASISKPRIIFCSEHALENIDKLSREAGFIKDIVVFGRPMSHKQFAFRNILWNKSSNFLPLEVDHKNLVAVILCSSGTTGLPKGVMLTHANILHAVEYVCDYRYSDMRPSDTVLAVLPMFHAYMFLCQLIGCIIGVKFVIMGRFEEDVFLRSIQNHKVVDVQSGQSLGPHKEGELCFRGPGIMKGYSGNLQATSAMIDSDGFLHTGDVGYYDEEGFFFIVDRVKELIKYKGFQVPPAELEAILLTHPAVKDVGVTALPDEKAGELPLAFIVKQPEAKVTKEDLINYVAGHVSPQKRLHGGVIFTDLIPRTPSGKILRRELKKYLKSKM
ncbi:luciferin 4-monooxygenase-like isoform X3 [Periplaneta americana]|uniref:luciferin 4-monooxygenase-like isoform X3 n=1 Tax=Periplaneta americana TaxID=6978 RepID=UPI0037E9424A